MRWKEPTVDEPLDEGALLYYLRTLPLNVGDRYSLDRYFRPDRNPVLLEVVRRERIQVPAGTFETIVIRPTIKSSGIFSENGRAEIWVTDDERHLMVQMTAKLSFGTLHLSLREIANVAVIRSPSESESEASLAPCDRGRAHRSRTRDQLWLLSACWLEHRIWLRQ